jgi:hypothetical protein
MIPNFGGRTNLRRPRLHTLVVRPRVLLLVSPCVAPSQRVSRAGGRSLYPLLVGQRMGIPIHCWERRASESTANSKLLHGVYAYAGGAGCLGSDDIK